LGIPRFHRGEGEHHRRPREGRTAVYIGLGTLLIIIILLVILL
jgi:hypothetical protein